MASKWVRVPFGAELPSISACYAVFEDRHLLYVGSAKRLRERFHGHQIIYGRINSVAVGCDPKRVTIAYRPSVRYGDWAMVELRLLRRLKPPVNSQHSTRRILQFKAAR